jgi:hypothetical protein
LPERRLPVSQEQMMSVAADHAEIVREVCQYVIDFVEQPQPKLGNLPVCPFARKARLENRIQYEVLELTREGVLAQVPLFTAKPELHLMICVHPSRDGVSSAEVYRLVDVLNEVLPAMNLSALGGHPEDPFNIDGLYTRREPYPNVQLLRLDVGERAHQSLKNSGYYDRWSESNLRGVSLRPDQTLMPQMSSLSSSWPAAGHRPER